MSCQAPHPTIKNHLGEPLTCRSSEGHRGTHASECWDWPNDNDPLQAERNEMLALLRIEGNDWDDGADRRRKELMSRIDARAKGG